MTIFDQIDNFIGLDRIGDYHSIIEAVMDSTDNDIIDFYQLASEALPSPRKDNTRFQFIADSTLSGFPHPCMSHECRLNKIKTIASFSAIYSDQTVLFNPFVDWWPSIIEENKPISYHFFNDVAIAINEMIMLKPLIERGIVSFTDFEFSGFCGTCLTKLIGTKTHISENADFSRAAISYLIETVDVTYEGRNEDGGYSFLLEGNNDFIEHDASFRTLEEMPPELSSLNPDTKVPKDLIISSGFFNDESNRMLSEHVTKASISKNYGIDNTFSSSNEMNMLSLLFRSAFKSQDFNALMPFLLSHKLNSIVEIRDEEWHHFEDFRSIFFKVINNIEPGNKAAEEAYRSEILPEMIKIEKIVEKSKNESGKSLAESSTTVGLSLISSVLTSGISDIISIAAGVLGGGHFAKKMVPQLYKRLSVPEKAKDSSFYYAWKVMNLK